MSCETFVHTAAATKPTGLYGRSKYGSNTLHESFQLPVPNDGDHAADQRLMAAKNTDVTIAPCALHSTGCFSLMRHNKFHTISLMPISLCRFATVITCLFCCYNTTTAGVSGKDEPFIGREILALGRLGDATSQCALLPYVTSSGRYVGTQWEKTLQQHWVRPCMLAEYFQDQTRCAPRKPLRLSPTKDAPDLEYLISAHPVN